jgi:hypothetical protein
MTESATIRGVVRNGGIEWREPLDSLFDEGEEVELRPARRAARGESRKDEDTPSTPEEIAADLAVIDSMEGPWLEPEARAAWEQDMADQNAFEKSRWDEENRKLESLFQ